MAWELSSSHLDSTNTNQVMNAPDQKSVQILIYLLKERHAGIRKPADLINASSHIEALLKIRGVIIPRGQGTKGQPLIIFGPSKLDLSASESARAKKAARRHGN